MISKTVKTNTKISLPKLIIGLWQIADIERKKKEIRSE